MTPVLVVTAAVLALSGALVLVRLLRGPTRYDRIVALDMLVIVVISGIAVDSALRRQGGNVSLLLVVALVGFLASVSAVRVLEEDDDGSR